MELILQQDLPHQQKAIDAVCGVLDGVHISAPTQFYKNPKIHLDDPKISANLREIQMKIPIQHRGTGAIGACLQMDAKMETGTGKTYVYTKTIYEMHKRYGLNKFIIVVPSLTIKAGTKQFLEDDYVRRHFTDSCGYGAEIESLVVDSPKNKKKGRNPFPGGKDLCKR